MLDKIGDKDIIVNRMSVIPKLYKSIESDDGAKEVEVDGILVLQKKLKLRSAQGTLFPAEVFVYEVG